MDEPAVAPATSTKAFGGVEVLIMTKRFGYLLSFTLVSLLGGMIAYSGWIVVTHPTIGALWDSTGVIYLSTTDASPAESLISTDRVLAVNGMAVSHFYSGLPETVTIGDTIEVTYLRDGSTQTGRFLVRRPDFSEIATLATAFPTAITAWIVGALLLFLSVTATDQKSVMRLTGALFILAAGSFAVGGFTALEPIWMYRAYSTSYWILGALGTLVHVQFPRPYAIARNRYAMIVLLAIGLGGAIWNLTAPVTLDGAVNGTAHRFGFIWFAINLVAWLGMLIWNWWRSPTLAERRQMGVVAVGGLLALGPLLGLILLPILLNIPDIPGSQLALLPVLLLPISYGYAILRFRKMAQDRWMARVIVYAFTMVIVVITFFLLMALPWFQQLPSENMVWVAAILGGLVAGPLMRTIDTGLSSLLFGRWTQPLQVAGTAMRTIDLRVERKDLSGQVRAIISRQLQIHHSAVLLLDAQNRLYDPEDSGLARPVEGMRLWPGSVLRRSLDDNIWVRELDDIRTALQASDDQRCLLEIPWARAILPLRFDNKLTGLILIGYRSGVSFYDIDELIVLELLAISAAAAFHRRKLFLDLEQERDQASMLSQQVLGVRTEERKRVARELHDDIIQPLIAHSYGLAVIDAPSAPTLRTNTLDLVEKIRLICAELREPTLDTLGLGAAVRAAVAAFQTRTQSKAELIVDQHPNASVPDSVASAALGVLQEALTNADKHAQARTIQVRVAIQPDVVRLNVRDDGKGFDVAEARRRAAKTNHFGLLGADERVASVGGIINVQSLPGQGTSIDVYLPLNAQQEGLSS